MRNTGKTIRANRDGLNDGDVKRFRKETKDRKRRRSQKKYLSEMMIKAKD